MSLPAHSKVGASSIKRWGRQCPGSVQLIEKLGVKSKSSVFAAEGTVAHMIGEYAIAGGKSLVAWEVGEVVEQDGFKIEVTDEMLDAVETYVKHVENLCGQTSVEVKFHLKELHPSLFGTNDACVYLPEERVLHVVDYKHGAGVPVEVIGNEQLRYYAVGAMLAHPDWQVDKVVMTIVQPRCPHPDGPIRSDEISALDLVEWSFELVEMVKATEDPDAPLKTGSECRWCAAAALCPEMSKQAVEAAATAFDTGASYDADYLASLLDQLDVIEGWCKSVREFAYAEAEQGRTPPGWKLVQKRAQRKWRDDGDAILALRKYKMDDEDIFNKSLRTVAQIEKIVGKKEAVDLFENLVVSESSGLTLVHESDKRPAFRGDAAEVFGTNQ